MKIVRTIMLSPKEIEEAVVAYHKLSSNTIITQLDKNGISITDYGAEGAILLIMERKALRRKL